MRCLLRSCVAFFVLMPGLVRAQQMADATSAGSPLGSLSSSSVATPPSSSSLYSADALLPAGIALPHAGMIHAIDVTAAGAVLVQLHPTEILSNSHAPGNFLRGQVMAGTRASVELKGLNSAVHLQSTSSSFLVRITGDDPELLRGRVHLIRLKQTKDRRLVATFSQNAFGGQHSKKFDDVPVTKVDAEPETWLKVTPETPLSPGEYGLAIMPTDPNLFPDVVYDFDVAVDAAKPEK